MVHIIIWIKDCLGIEVKQDQLTHILFRLRRIFYITISEFTPVTNIFDRGTAHMVTRLRIKLLQSVPHSSPHLLHSIPRFIPHPNNECGYIVGLSLFVTILPVFLD